jgi:hypothetical protein
MVKCLVTCRLNQLYYLGMHYFRDVIPCKLTGVTDFREKYIISIFYIEEKATHPASRSCFCYYYTAAVAEVEICKGNDHFSK